MENRRKTKFLHVPLTLLACLSGAGVAATAASQENVRGTWSPVSVSVLPSLSEGLPKALLESMAAGVPVVGTRVGGTPEVVKGGVMGLPVPPRDPPAPAAAVAALLGDPARTSRMGEAGQRRVEERFSLETMVRQTERLYESLLARAA